MPEKEEVIPFPRLSDTIASLKRQANGDNAFQVAERVVSDCNNFNCCVYSYCNEV